MSTLTTQSTQSTLKCQVFWNHKIWHIHCYHFPKMWSAIKYIEYWSYNKYPSSQHQLHQTATSCLIINWLWHPRTSTSLGSPLLLFSAPDIRHLSNFYRVLFMTVCHSVEISNIVLDSESRKNGNLITEFNCEHWVQMWAASRKSKYIILFNPHKSPRDQYLHIMEERGSGMIPDQQESKCTYF